MSTLSILIKEKATELGFHKVGIARADAIEKDKQNLEEWIRRKQHASMDWVEKRKDERGDVFKYFPEVKTIISLGYNYYVGKDQSALNSKYKFSNYAWGEDYHEVLKEKLFLLLQLVKKANPTVKGLVCVDTAPIMEKVWAQKAGLGWQGKHTNLITKDYGSWIFLGELLLDIELEPDPPFLDDLCGTCTACIDACPTMALQEYKLDANKCISYLTIEHRGDFHSGQNDLDGWIYGCDICQEVCPWNIKFSDDSGNKDFMPREKIADKYDEDWERLTEKEFRVVFKKSAVKRTKHSGLLRNINNNKNIN
tara:strand:- start:98 stop:1024 length:927 start_codon:yes stop_codon:yes gene_type:complete